MEDIKISSAISEFNSQQDVDQFVLQTEKLAEKINNEDIAIQLYKNISYLRAASELYFVPDIVFSWKDLALSYIKSSAALFECVYYEQIAKIHQQGFDVFQSLEPLVLNNSLSANELFSLIHGFNVDMKEFNKYCKKYHKEQFNYYKCNNDILEQKYQIWLTGGIL